MQLLSGGYILHLHKISFALLFGVAFIWWRGDGMIERAIISQYQQPFAVFIKPARHTQRLIHKEIRQRRHVVIIFTKLTMNTIRLIK